ncbi:hypothetical protein HN385_05495 [archaeon]|jgi:hypothetical protein|nr:hypothetical protein [archaeon]MBT3451685.1 hypothetical protein [archaeon]MBT6869462.1 hypothetical protein [archaeon]MBT7193150.1 hypothetical protein [archaeon]MBT7380456.1 hypothetical protein [archaeon]
MLRKLLSKVIKIKKTRAKKGQANIDNDGNVYDNRFVKFYHLNKKRLNKERRGSYKSKSKGGICVRCNRKAVKDIVFCKYHQARQKEYNAKARAKTKKGKKK